MEKVKISTLAKENIVIVNDDVNTTTVADILEDIESYREARIYTTIPVNATFDAESILDIAIENEQENVMYEDWDELIKADVTKEDIADLQKIFDRILARNPGQNIAYQCDRAVEIDI